jgi:hypothetical protein
MKQFLTLPGLGQVTLPTDSRQLIQLQGKEGPVLVVAHQNKLFSWGGAEWLPVQDNQKVFNGADLVLDGVGAQAVNKKLSVPVDIKVSVVNGEVQTTSQVRFDLLKDVTGDYVALQRVQVDEVDSGGVSQTKDLSAALIYKFQSGKLVDVSLPAFEPHALKTTASYRLVQDGVRWIYRSDGNTITRSLSMDSYEFSRPMEGGKGTYTFTMENGRVANVRAKKPAEAFNLWGPWLGSTRIPGMW